MKKHGDLRTRQQLLCLQEWSRTNWSRRENKTKRNWSLTQEVWILFADFPSFLFEFWCFYKRLCIGECFTSSKRQVFMTKSITCFNGSDASLMQEKIGWLHSSLLFSLALHVLAKDEMLELRVSSSDANELQSLLDFIHGILEMLHLHFFLVDESLLSKAFLSEFSSHCSKGRVV
jgi:hypothetical protein